MGRVRFINRITNTEMWVTDERVEEYKAAGHTLAADDSIAKEPWKKVEEPKKTVAKKTTTKKR